MSKYDNRNDDDDDDDDDKPYDDGYGEKPLNNRDFNQFMSKITGGMFVTPEEQEKAIKEQKRAISNIVRRLGGDSSERKFLLHMRSELRKIYPPLTVPEQLKTFLDELDEEYRYSIATNSALPRFMELWDRDRRYTVVVEALKMLRARILQLSDDPLPPRQEMHCWLDSVLCFCGKCDNDL